MCGVFGVVVSIEQPISTSLVERVVTHLARAAESRGKDSSGLVLRRTGRHELQTFKGNVRIMQLLESPEVKAALRAVSEHAGARASGTVAAMGHSRLVTNGSQLHDVNNQPVLKDGVIGIHNGIITNDADIWTRHPAWKRHCEIDTEVLLALISAALADGHPIDEAVALAAGEVEGTFSIATMFTALPRLVLASNNGSLYVLTNERDVLAFASEEWPVKSLWSVLPSAMLDRASVTQITPERCAIVSLDEFAVDIRRARASASGGETPPLHFGGRDGLEGREEVAVHLTIVPGQRPRQELVLDTAEIAKEPSALAESRLLEHNADRIEHLRRCTRCVLPETFPFISFDEHGVCSYCHGYRLRNQPKPFAELVALVEPYRRKDGRPDCIVPFSGGRDSTYALHLIKDVLHLNPIAFTYDWGMVTDLGRRNIARVCGKLGVENIIVAADIYKKRDNIRRNVLAWLRCPRLGMVPLFMAGDKYFYYYAGRVAQQTGIRLNIWGINPLENTDFKVGFLGVPPDFGKRYIYTLSLRRQLKLFGSVAREVTGNPAYVNRSVLNTAGGFVSRSIMPHTDYYHLFDYVRWDETEVEDVLFGAYDWERACDTVTTWRIGDGTAAFYNYIYYTVAGFSEYDTFRSNQIREGQLSRVEALALAARDNQPRYPTIKWYLAILGLEYESTIRRINSIPKLY